MPVTPKEAREILWRRGNLRWKLYPQDQRAVYDWIVGPHPSRRIVINIARQFGKTYIIVLVAVEFALKHPGALVRLVTSTRIALRKFIRPNMATLLLDCPDDVRPSYDGQEHCYRFPNGSEIHLAGVNNGHEDDARGQRSDLNVVDEAGFVDRLEYVVKSVLTPQTKTTGGRTILISTPPETPAHDFVPLMWEAESNGSYLHLTIDDDKHTPQAEKDELIQQLGGPEATAVLRECYGQVVVEETKAVVPEFNQKRSARIVQPTEPPSWEQPIVAMDVGFEDFHAILYGYWDFRRAKLVIQAEDILRQATTDKIAEAIKATEDRLWSKRRSNIPPARWTDVDLRLVADLWQMHGLGITPTAKDDLEAQVNALRLLVKEEKIQIDPACVTLIRQLRSAIWKDNRTQFERTKAEGHFDAVAAMIYLVRNVNRATNPYPILSDGVTDATHYIRAGLKRPNQEHVEALAAAFGKGRR